MSKNTYEAVCIMFEEIKEKLEALTQANQTKNGYTLPEVDKIIRSIKIPTPDTKQLENIAISIHSEINNAIKRMETLAKRKEEDKVISHIHSIELKSTKVCITLIVLVLALLLSLFLNFR